MPHPYNNIPSALKSRPNWVTWGIRDAPLKSPFNPTSLLSGRPLPAKAGVKETWSSYQAASECVERGLAQGIGYEFDGNGVYGVDLDHVIDGTGKLTPNAREVLNKLKSYTEISPSGTGVHTFVFAPDANITRHRKKDYFLEIYSEGRYFTVTGNAIGGMKAIETRTAELQGIHDKFLMPDAAQKVINRPPPVTVQSSAEQEQFLQTGLERDKVFAEMWAGRRRHGNESGDDQALMNKLAYWCNADLETMIQAFLQSPYHAQKDDYHKKKCQRSDYLWSTANNSCATTYSTAKADRERWLASRNRERSYAR